MNKIKYFIVGFLVSILLAACSGGGTCNTNTPTPPVPSLTLQLTAPTQYPAGVAVTAYLTIFNNSEVNAESLVYTVPTVTNHTGVDITIDPNGNNEDCTNIPSGTSCVFTANIPAGSVPGSFTVIATPTVEVTNQVAKLTSIAPQALSLQLTANIGLSEIPNVPGMFYIMPETKRVAVNAESSTVVQLVVLVRPNTPAFNSLSFVDRDGNPLQSEVLGANSLTESVITYNVVIPAGKSVQDVMLKAQNNTSDICSLDGNGLPVCSNTAYVYRQGADTGFLTVAPRYTTLESTANTQIMTITNQGTAAITNFSMPTLSAPLSIDTSYPNTCANITSLDANGSCSFRISYDVANANSGARNLVFNYNNGLQSQTATSTITYIGTSNNLYVFLIFSPEAALLTEAGESYVVQVTNLGNVNVEELEFDLEDGTYYPVFVYDEGSCSDGIESSGGGCYLALSYFGATTAGVKILPYVYEYYDPETDEDIEESGIYQVSYSTGTGITPTILSRVTPSNGSSSTEYYTTIELRFDGELMDLSTVTGETIKLLANGTDSMGLTAPITRVSYNGSGFPRTTVNFAVESQFYENVNYTVSIPDLGAVLNINGESIVLDSGRFTTSTPLVTFTASGFNGNYLECGGENCIKSLNPNNTIATCGLLSNGGLVNCSTPEVVTGLTTNIATATVDGIFNGLPSSGMTSFALATNTGVFGGIDVNPVMLPYTFIPSMNMGQTLTNPTGIAINGGIAYVVNNGSIYQCNYDILNGFTSCIQLTMQGVSSDAYGIYIANPASLSESLMIIANRDSNTVTTCLASGGTFAGATCNTNALNRDDEPYVFDKPFGIVAASHFFDANQYYVFITNSGVVGFGDDDNAITRCELSDTGSLIGCRGYGEALYSHPTSISMMFVPDLDSYINVANDNGSMTTCDTGYGGVYCNRYGYKNVFESSVSIMQFHPGTP